MRQCTSVTDRWTDVLASWHKREMYILYLALKMHSITHLNVEVDQCFPLHTILVHSVLWPFACLSVCLSVCPSVTSWRSIKRYTYELDDPSKTAAQ